MGAANNHLNAPIRYIRSIRGSASCGFDPHAFQLGMACPKCSSSNIHHSEFEPLEWFWLFLTFRRPYRCQNCRERFWDYFWKL